MRIQIITAVGFAACLAACGGGGESKSAAPMGGSPLEQAIAGFAQASEPGANAFAQAVRLELSKPARSIGLEESLCADEGIAAQARSVSATISELTVRTDEILGRQETPCTQEECPALSTLGTAAANAARALDYLDAQLYGRGGDGLGEDYLVEVEGVIGFAQSAMTSFAEDMGKPADDAYLVSLQGIEIVIRAMGNLIPDANQSAFAGNEAAEGLAAALRQSVRMSEAIAALGQERALRAAGAEEFGIQAGSAVGGASRALDEAIEQIGRARKASGICTADMIDTIRNAAVDAQIVRDVAVDCPEGASCTQSPSEIAGSEDALKVAEDAVKAWKAALKQL